jgi:hypothetical protein
MAAITNRTFILTTGARPLYFTRQLYGINDVIHSLKAGLTLDSARCQLWTGWSVECRQSGKGGFTYKLFIRHDLMPLCFLCWKKERSAALWHRASGLVPPGIVLREPGSRDVPWLAVTLTKAAHGVALNEPGLAADLADIERQIAWALLEGAQ